MSQKSITIFADKITQAALREVIEKYGFSMQCAMKHHDEEGIVIKSGSEGKTFSAPVHVGQIIDQIEYFKNKAQKKEDATIHFGKARLNVHVGTFINESGTKIQLTEKEVEILAYLNDKKGQIVTREELLNTVWNYAKDVETHTLETHIYRLRQKIESDPTSPTIIKTEENGYCV